MYKEKILYYLGAGASANVLPLAKTIFNTDGKTIKISGLLDSMANLKWPEEYATTEVAEFFKETRNMLTNLAEVAEPFGDLDTYAKFLYHSNEDAFYELKTTLDRYFVIQQQINKVLDRRYLGWLVGVMSAKRFPQNIKVLSWNYDFQLETAASVFGDYEQYDIANGGSSYRPGFLNHYPSLNRENTLDYEPDVLHLNGIAGFYFSKVAPARAIFSGQDLSKEELVARMQNHGTAITFAWESPSISEELLTKARRLIAGTTIMVVVGYSFPFFNREVDRYVFDILKMSTRVSIDNTLTSIPYFYK